MAFLWGDTADYYASADLLKKWSTKYGGTNVTTDPVISAGNGRRGGGCIRFQSSSAASSRPLGRVVPASGATAVFGFAFRNNGTFANMVAPGAINNSFLQNSAGSGPLIARLNMTGNLNFGTHLGFFLNQNGTITAARNNNSSAIAAWTLIGNSTTALTQDTYQHLEFKVLLSTSATGTVEVRLNGVSTPIITASSIITSQNGPATWDEIVIGEVRSTLATVTWDYDDIYIMDGSGSYNNTFIGDQRADALFMTADGTYTDSTPSTGSDRYAVQDEASANGDTDYTTFAASGNKDSYVMQNCPVGGATVNMMQINHWAKRAASGSAILQSLFRTGGADYFSGDKGLSSDYVNLHSPYDRSPVDGTTALSTALIDGAEVGMKKV